MKRKTAVLFLTVIFALAGCGNVSSASSDGTGTEFTVDTAEPADPDGADHFENGTAKYTYYLRTEKNHDFLNADDGSYRTIAAVSYDVLEAESDIETKEVPAAVVKAVAAVNADTENISGSFFSEEGENAQEYYNSLSDDEKESFGGFADDNALLVVRADSRCFSLIRNHYRNLAGAHGYTRTTAYSFDAETGQKLTATDIVADTDSLAGILAQELLKTHVPAEFNDVSEDNPQEELTARIQALMDGDDSYDGDNDLHYVTWYVDQGGISFVFNQYDLGPYAAGQFKCTLKAVDYPELLKTEFLYGPENYGQELSLASEYEVDGEMLEIYAETAEYRMVERVHVTLGEKEDDFEVWGYNIRPFLMTVSAGKYLYIDMTTDNDWHVIYSYDLGAGELEAKEMNGLGFRDIPTDPDNMILSTRVSLMSSLPSIRSYSLSPAQDGFPEPNEDYFTVIGFESGIPVFTLKQDAELNILDDPESSSTHKETVTKGTTMQMIRTDNESVADCLTSDGRYIRFTVDESDWPQKIDGLYDLEDLLDGVIFVG